MLIRLLSISLIALDIDTVSPLLNASNIRNFRTDCSIDKVLSCAGGAIDLGTCWFDVDLISPAVPVENFELWLPRGWWWWCDTDAGVGDGAVVGEDANGPSSTALSSSLPSFLRSRESADDLPRLRLDDLGENCQ